LGNPAVGVAQLQEVYSTLKELIPGPSEGFPTQVTGGAAPQQWWGVPWSNLVYNGTATGAQPWAEKGVPTGTGSYSADGIFFNDVFDVPESLMAFGVGTTDFRSADHDGFSSRIGTGSVVSNKYTDIVNPLFDGTYATEAPSIYGDVHVRYLQGIPMLNLDLSFYDTYATAEEVATNIKATYAVAATANIGGFWESGHDNETLAVRPAGWRIVRRDSRYYMIVSCDIWQASTTSLAAINGSCALFKK